MGFFEKVKNMFTEEVEDDEVKVEQIKKDVTKVEIESPKSKEKQEEDFDNFELKLEDKINKPVFFDDNDFRDLNFEDNYIEKREKKEEKKEIYSTRLEPERIIQPKERKNFKPTPIISPVYGILDKNYHKEDIVSRNEVKTENEPVESAIDAIRNKAYGTLEDELENTLFGTNSILFKKNEEKEELEIKEVDDNVLTDLTDDISKELDELLIRKEKYIDDVESDNVDSNINDDLLGFIDSTLYKEGDE